MKNFADLVKDLMENEELKLEAKKALNSNTLKVSEDRFGDVVAFGKEHGYDFTEEDIHLHRAANRILDDSELEMVNGGGRADSCSCDEKDQCSKAFGCYSDYMCQSAQMTTWGGKGECNFDYACHVSWNSCLVSNQCQFMEHCNSNAF